MNYRKTRIYRKIKTGILSAIFTQTVLFTGCAFLTRNNDFPQHNKTGITVLIEDPLSSVTAVQNRSAVPRLPAEELVDYEITATAVADTNQSVSCTEPISDGSSFYTKKYRLEITQGEWEIKVNGFVKSGGSEESTANKKEVFYGQKNIMVDESGEYEVTIPVYYIESGTGSVKLDIDVKDSFIEKLVIKGTGTAKSSVLDGEYFRNENGIIAIERTQIPAATYSALLCFYENIGDSSSPKYSHLISLQEKINVRKNTTTDSWNKSGKTIYLTDGTETSGSQNNTTAQSGISQTKFVLTNRIITQLVNTSFYVASKDKSNRKLPATAADSSDYNSGSWADPFESLQAAVNKISAVSRNEEEQLPYTIFIDGEIKAGGCKFSNFPDGKEPYIYIKPYINSENETSALLTGKTDNSSEETNQIAIGAKASVCFADIQIQNCGLTVEENGKIILSGNTAIKGKPIYLKGSAKFFVEDITSSSQNQNGPQNQNTLIARIKCDEPDEGKTVIEGNNGIELSEGIIGRFRLQNPGYYLVYNSAQKKGVVKSSSISIRLPKVGGCSAKISALAEDGSLVACDENCFIISSEYFSENDQIIFSASVEIPDLDSNGNKIKLAQSAVQMKLYSGLISVLSGENLLLEKGKLLSGKYILDVIFEYDGLMYDAKAGIMLN